MTESFARKSVINTGVALASQVLVALAGLFLPQALILNYGSGTNGLITSLQQVIAYLTLIEGGITAALAFSLYKPIAEKDQSAVNWILSSARMQYNRLGAIYLLALLVLVSTYPAIVRDSPFSYVQTSMFVFLAGVNGATQILFSGKYKALFMASQRNGLSLSINALSTALFSLVLVVCAYAQVHPLVATGLATCAYIGRALMFYVAARYFYPNARYDLSGTFKFHQQKDTLTQQLMVVVILNSPVLIMTILQAPLSEISVYTMYNLVLASVFMLFYAIENSLTASFGGVIAKGDERQLARAFRKFTSVYFLVWPVAIACVLSLYEPFVAAYTVRVTDVQYVRPLDILICALLGAFWTLRNMQSLTITAAGRYREMRTGFVVETGLTLAVSSVGYVLFGLTGVLAGRLVSTIYRFVDLSLHNFRHVLKCDAARFVKRMAVAWLSVAIASGAYRLLSTTVEYTSLTIWAQWAVVCLGVSAAVTVLLGWLLVPEDMRVLRHMVSKGRSSSAEA